MPKTSFDVESSLMETIDMLDAQIKHIYDTFTTETTTFVKSPLELRYADGSFMLVPLITAKAQALAALVQFRDMRSRIVAERSNFFGPTNPMEETRD